MASGEESQARVENKIGGFRSTCVDLASLAVTLVVGESLFLSTVGFYCLLEGQSHFFFFLVEVVVLALCLNKSVADA